jgi:hypothetical protein
MNIIAASRNRPPFEDYIEWAKGQGCKVNETHVSRENGHTYTIVTFVTPSGAWAVEVTSPDDYLISNTVARLDRRLGLKSSFF